MTKYTEEEILKLIRPRVFFLYHVFEDHVPIVGFIRFNGLRVEWELWHDRPMYVNFKKGNMRHTIKKPEGKILDRLKELTIKAKK